jgi:hypothetical protein
MVDGTIPVKDGMTEKNAVITNLLITAVLVVGGWFGDGVLDHLKSINESMTSALENIARVQQITKGHSSDITELRANDKEASRERLDLKIGQNSIINQLKTYERSHKEKLSISSND